MDHRMESPEIDRRILLIRGQRVMLDADLAEIYRVSTKRINEQVSRNRLRFPTDFMFRLTQREKAEVVAKCDHLQKLKFSPNLPAAFTEDGVVMLANVLKSPVAIPASIQIVRAFNRMRRLVATHKDVAATLAALERKVASHDDDIRALFAAIRRFLEPPPEPLRRIGFKPD
jgi:hypothetical protein